jgi:hypothetical protein
MSILRKCGNAATVRTKGDRKKGESPMAHAGMNGISNSIRLAALRMAVGIGTAALISAAGAILTPSPASAKPEYAAQTHLACGRCHVNPAGGGALKSFGKKFQANGHKLK